MSTVFITSHDENIYDTVKEVQRKEQKARYVSKHHKRVEADAKKKGGERRTLGPADVPLKGPAQFLKKRSGGRARRPACECVQPGEARCFKQTSLPPVPGHTVADKGAPDKQQASVNFVLRNVLNVKRSAPPQRCRRVAYTRHGDTQCLQPNYICKKARRLRESVGGLCDPQQSRTRVWLQTFGKMPRYLLRRFTQEEQAEQQQSSREADARPAVRLVTAEEQAALLKGMRQNWEELQRAFQLLPLQTDTVPKQRRKAGLEEELKKLEHNIRTVERHPHIYVYDDDLV
ncbi:enkurin isoform X1 [Bacillus rossius redtenbacheri]|uniref:enkurin isoform X1 n=1 Tax=Bacillus rossius redtenbacheri TaxID=93214 RepID=UPI002FDD2C63